MNNKNWKNGVGAALLVAATVAGCNSQLTKHSKIDWFTLDQASVSAEPGLSERPLNQSCLATRFEQPAAIRLEPLVPENTFRAPLSATSLPGDDDTLYVLEQHGIIWRLELEQDGFALNEWLPLRDTFNVVFLPDGCHECGLYSLAFHPDFSDNGYIYLSFTEGGDDAPLVSKVVRVRSPDGGESLAYNDNGSLWYETIYEVRQPTHIHNNGRVGFGPDGYLYLSLGDGGPTGDPNGNAQNIHSPYGSLLRLTDEGEPAPGNQVEGGLPELYAYGLRNAWRWSFDRKTGELWAGDVGDGRFEEINRIENGGNYGWPCLEGFDPTGDCAVEEQFLDPEWNYGRADGRSITGGYVYRGEQLPELEGRYVFADFGSGVIWGLYPDAEGQYEQRQLLLTGGAPVAFTQDDQGELYVVDYRQGNLAKIQPAEPDPNRVRIPERLSETGCLNAQDPTQPAEGLIPYDLREPFWSDGAQKERYMALPDHARVTVQADGHLEFPVGSVLVKQFRLQNQLVETRLLLNQAATGWIGYSYRWNAEQTEATLLSDSKDVSWGNQLWHYPSSAECAQCHTAAAGFSLGPEVQQLDRPVEYPRTGIRANQLDTLAHLKLFDRPIPSALRADAMPASRDESQPLEARARSFLHSNCANCHRPGGTSQSTMDWRYQTPMALTNACDKPPLQSDLGIREARLMAPGEPERSILWQRIAHQTEHRMPPLGSHRIDREGAALIADWIRSQDGCYTLAGPVSAEFAVRNIATRDLLDVDQGRPLLTSDTPPERWQVEDGDAYYRLRLASSETEYLHAERPQLAVGTILPRWWSAEWELVPNGDAFMIRNRWRDDLFLKADPGSGVLRFGPVRKGDPHGLWQFEEL